jgi:O-methyltransferase involved in polyketide biosynthesis
MSAADARISPTAHYTGYVWYRAGLSDPALVTRAGELLYGLVAPLNAVAYRLGGMSLERMLLARHTIIDRLLSAAIESGEVGQVLEIAAGLSYRGRRFSSRYCDRGLVYVEGDLPGMAKRKTEMLRRAPVRPGEHHVAGLDAFSESDLQAVCDRYLDRSRGVAVITEGLAPYVDTPSVLGMWRRFAGALSGFSRGLYLSDMHVEDDFRRVTGGRFFTRALSVFARGALHEHFDGASAAEQALRESGFSRASVYDASDFFDRTGIAVPPGATRILQAWR